MGKNNRDNVQMVVIVRWVTIFPDGSNFPTSPKHPKTTDTNQ